MLHEQWPSVRMRVSKEHLFIYVTCDNVEPRLLFVTPTLKITTGYQMQPSKHKAIYHIVEGGIHTKMIRNAQAEIKLPSFGSMPMDNEIKSLFLKHVMLSFLRT